MSQPKSFPKAWNNRLKETLIIVPCYNEAQNLTTLLPEVKTIYPNTDILLINDASTDASQQIAKQHATITLRNTSNLGITQTVSKGYHYGLAKGYKYVVRVDGDGQHPPDQIHKLLKPLYAEKADVSIGSRLIAKRSYSIPFPRKQVIYLFTFIINLINSHQFKDPTSGFIAVNQKALKYIHTSKIDQYFEPVIVANLLNTPFKIKEVSVTMRQRTYGKSSITILKGIRFTIMITTQLLRIYLKTRLQKDKVS